MHRLLLVKHPKDLHTSKDLQSKSLTNKDVHKGTTKLCIEEHALVVGQAQLIRGHAIMTGLKDTQ